MNKTIKPECSIVVPAYNEEASLEELAGEILSEVEGLGLSFEIILVDDGSTDGTAKVIKSLSSKRKEIRPVFLPFNRGKAAALAEGFKASTGSIIVTLDADLQDDPSCLPKFLEKLGNGYDLVCGWKKPRHDNWRRRASSFLFNKITSFLFGPRLHDHNCGFKAYKREVADRISLYGELHRFATFLAHALGFRVGEVIVNHRPRRYGQSRYGIERIWRSMFDLFTVSLITQRKRHVFRFFAAIGTPLSLLGLVICTSLFFLPNSDALSHMPLFLSGILAFLIGIQLFAAGLLGEFILSLWWLINPGAVDSQKAGTDGFEFKSGEKIQTFSESKVNIKNKKSLFIGPDKKSCFGQLTILENFPGIPQSLLELTIWCWASGIQIMRPKENGKTIPFKPSLFQRFLHLPLFFIARYHARPMHFFGLWGGLTIMLGFISGIAVKLSHLSGMQRYFLMELALGIAVTGIELFIAGLLGELLAYLRSFIIKKNRFNH